jgi:7-keto-8-aminopelargonate synthetase-like enzyme
MLPKYTIEYVPPLLKHSPVIHYSTDDPVTCEQLVEELLGRGFHIKAIKHEGMDLPRQDFDRMIKTAAATMASKCICASLGIKPDEVKYRFGFAA